MQSKGAILILSTDGGGSRGLIAANVLYHMEKKAEIPIRETFDFSAGVSTGAMVAAYLARNAGTMEEVAKKAYSSENLSKIMNKSIWDRILGRLQNQPKYDGQNERAYVSSVTQDSRINDITDKFLLILAYDFINRELVTFKNNRGHDGWYNPSLTEVCDAASAAPTLREIWVVSLGTGRPMHELSQDERDRIGEASRDWGIVGWVANGLLDHMMSASSCVSTHRCEQLLGDHYVRVGGELPRKLMQLDNTSETRIADLQSYAFLWFEEHIGRVQQFLDDCDLARRRWGEEAKADGEYAV
jgi:hypothetical protein